MLHTQQMQAFTPSPQPLTLVLSQREREQEHVVPLPQAPYCLLSSRLVGNILVQNAYQLF